MISANNTTAYYTTCWFIRNIRFCWRCLVDFSCSLFKICHITTISFFWICFQAQIISDRYLFQVNSQKSTVQLSCGGKLGLCTSTPLLVTVTSPSRYPCKRSSTSSLKKASLSVRLAGWQLSFQWLRKSWPENLCLGPHSQWLQGLVRRRGVQFLFDFLVTS